MFRVIKRSALFLLLLCLGCSAQSTGPAQVNQRVEKLVRAHFNISPTVNVKVTGRKPSPDFAGFDVVTVTLSRDEKSKDLDFLLSKDNKKLMEVTPIEDPMDKINLAGRPSRGKQDAKVVIVNFDDFQCPFCARNHQELMQDILKQYGDKIRIVYKDFPLVEIHPWAMHAAVDANCLAAQSNDAYWDFADYVHANQKDISGSNRPLPEQYAALDQLTEKSGRLRGLNTGKLEACVKAQDTSAVKESMKEGDDLGISATPTMYINSLKYDGAVPAEQLKAAIDRALKDAGEPVPPSSAAAPAGNAPAPPPAH